MPTIKQTQCALYELDALLAEYTPRPRDLPGWLAEAAVTGDVRRLTDADLCEIAAERDDCGPHAAINSLIEGLRVRHQNDRVTLAALAALQEHHLPTLRDQFIRS